MVIMLTHVLTRMVLHFGAPANTWAEQAVEALPALEFSPTQLMVVLPMLRLQLT
jgi:hypothetical protein